MSYKVCITAAGVGSRINKFTNLHKALLPLNHQTILTKIINKFPNKIEIILALGHQKKIVKEFIKLAHPKRRIKIVEIKKFKGKGSGPGYTLLKCSKYLNCPFIFIACDTIVNQKIPEPSRNWVGISKVENPKDFLVVETEKKIAKKFYDKKNLNYFKNKNFSQKYFNAFIGLAGIKDFELFWKLLKSNKKLKKSEFQVSNGLELLAKNKKIYCNNFEWHDSGNEKNYNQALKAFKDKNQILPKSNEFFYIENDLVFKYFENLKTAKLRNERAQILKSLVPSIIKTKLENFVVYKFYDGKLLSEIHSEKIFKQFLTFCKKNLWSVNYKKKIYLNEIKKLKISCHNFYKVKTQKRIKKYLKNKKDYTCIINNTKVPSIFALLKKINWNSIINPIPAMFHGDLQPENIIYNRGKFKLLDWRESFDDLKVIGDIYYDLAKIHHALIVSGKMIRADNYYVKEYKDRLTVYVKKRKNLTLFLKILENYVQDNGLDIVRLKTMSALIFLNIAPLHHFPYSKFLFNFGKLQLFNALNYDK